MRRVFRGEMTVFLALTLMLVASLLFTLIEGARYRCLRSIADMDRIMEAESSFADYNVELLKHYGLLYLDDSYGTGTENINRIAGRIQTLSESNLNPDTGFMSDLLRMKMTDCGIDEYELATDYGGDAFRRQAVEYTKENMGGLALGAIEDRVQKGKSGKTMEDTAGYDSASKVSSGRDAAKSAREAEEAAREKGEELTPNGITPATDFENPLDLFDTLRAGSLLAVVMPSGRQPSVKKADLSDSLLRRSRNRGNFQDVRKTSIADRMLFLMYLDQSFGCFTEVKEGKCLDYEQEYIISGHDSDQKNLEDVLSRILLIREVTNFLYLQTDAEKVAIAESIAVAIGTATMTLLFVELIKQAILAAWAYVESLCELKTLLSGGKVAIIKTAKDWQTDVLHPATSFKRNNGEGDDPLGLSYRDYLMQFILLMGDETLNYRAMDMIELNIRMLEGKKTFRMDCMIQKMNLSYRYEARPLFLSFVTIGDIDRGNYRFDQEYGISYLTGS